MPYIDFKVIGESEGMEVGGVGTKRRGKNRDRAVPSWKKW